MKIVHVEDVFHPDTGYQLNLLSKYMVAAGHDVTIICAETTRLPKDFMSFFGSEDINKRDAEFTRKYGVRIIRVPIYGYYSGRAFLSSELFRIIKKENPDIVYVHGNDTVTGIRFLLHRKELNYPLVMDSHMLDMAAKNRFSKVFRLAYRYLFTPIIISNKIPVIRTQDSDFVEKAYGIPLSQAPWISTGSDTMLFKPDKSVKEWMRRNQNIPDNAFVITYAGKLDEAKGGMLLADALYEKLSCDKELCFVVIGNTNGDYGKKVEQRLSESKNRIIRFPTQKYMELAPFFQMSDLVVFPKQCSLSFYDAQACGVPVIFEENEVNSKRAMYNSAKTFSQDSIDGIRDCIVEMASMSNENYMKMSDAAVAMVKNSYDYKDICNIYLSILEKEIGRV